MKNILYFLFFIVTIISLKITNPTIVLGAAKEQSQIADVLSQNLDDTSFINSHNKSAISKFCILSSIFYGLMGLIFLYNKYNKENDVTFKGDYYRDLPNDYSPAELGFLLHFKTTNSNDILATLLNMSRLGYLKMELINFEKTLTKPKKDDIRFSLDERNDYENLKRHERFLIEWLILEVGHNKCFDSSSITNTDYANKKSLAFARKYNEWKSYVEIDALNNNFFENTTSGFFCSLFFSITYFIVGTIGLLHFKLFSCILFILIGILFLIYGATIKKRSIYGQEQYEKWMGFKRFLKDFSQMPDYKIHTLSIWEHYLIYAIPLDIAKEVIDNLPKSFDLYNFEIKGCRIFTIYGGHLSSLSNMFVQFNRSTSTFNNAIDLTLCSYHHQNFSHNQYNDLAYNEPNKN